MRIFIGLLTIVLTVANIVAFYKAERLVKINKGWFPFFHLVMGIIVIGILAFLVSFLSVFISSSLGEKFLYGINWLLSFSFLILVTGYVGFILVKLAGLKGWYTIFFFIPLVNILFNIYLYYKISKNFGKGIGWTLLLFFFFPFTFPVLILAYEKNYKANEESKTKKEKN